MENPLRKHLSIWAAALFIFLGVGCDNNGGSESSWLEIQSLKAEPSVVRPGEKVVLTASVSGTDLAYTWRADAGSLSAADTNPVTWTAPDSVGGVSIHLEVADKEGAKALGFASVLVSVSPAGPVITSVNPAEAKAGSEVRVTGAGFGNGQGGGSLTIGGVAANDIFAWSDTEIRAAVPEGATTGAVKVILGGAESSPGALVVLWAKENPENAAIATAGGDQIYPRLIADGAGGAIVAWADFRNGTTSDLYAQRVNGAGAPQWAADGAAISMAANNQSFPQLASDGAGGAIVVWEDNRSGGSDIYAQRIDRDGAVRWTADGIPIATAAGAQFSPQVMSDGAGGAFIVWLDFRNGPGSDLYMQRVGGDGIVQWAADGVPLSIAAQPQQSPQLVPDGAGGAIVVWQDHRGGSADIYAQRIDGSGAVLWTANGIPLCAAAGNQQLPNLISDGAGGAIVVWQDMRSGVDKVYGQRVSGGGATAWAADGFLIAATPNPQTAPQIVSDGSGGAIIAWQEGAGGSDVFMQRVNGSGAAQWAPEGIPASAATDAQAFPQLVSDGSGGALVTWTDRRSGTNNDLYAQRINSAGVVQWTANGIPVATAANDQSTPLLASSPRIAPDGAGGAIIVWQDRRGGTAWDIYAQGVSAGGRQ